MTHPKNALIFAASGAIASGVAREMAGSGFEVHVSAKRPGAAAELAESIRKLGGRAQAADIDALDQTQVRSHVEHVKSAFGSVDAVFNGIGGRPSDLKYPARSSEATVSDMLLPVDRILGSQFLTAREAARVMVGQKSGAIVFLSATLSGGAFAYMAGISATCGAIEAMMRSFTAEFSPAGVRVNCVRGSGMPETRTIQETFAGQAALRDAPPSFGPPLLGRPISVLETAKVATFLASDASSGMNGQVVTVCAGQYFFN